MARHKNNVWNCGETSVTLDQAQLAVPMDIRDELQSMNAKMGADLRRRKRNAAKKRKAAKTNR